MSYYFNLRQDADSYLVRCGSREFVCGSRSAAMDAVNKANMDGAVVTVITDTANVASALGLNVVWTIHARGVLEPAIIAEILNKTEVIEYANRNLIT